MWKARKDAGIANHLHGLGLVETAHRARDWYGTALYASTKDLRLTQEMMRHSDPSSTAQYVAFNQPGAADAVASLSPRRRLIPR